MIETLLQKANLLGPIPLASAMIYHNKKSDLLNYVNSDLQKNSHIGNLIGNDFELMKENHKNHINFMDNVFHLNNFELLAKTVIWVYKMYHAHGFEYDYFPIELKSWIDAVHTFIPSPEKESILAVYNWMIDQHNTMINLSKEKKIEDVVSDDPNLNVLVTSLVQNLIKGDHRECIKLARSYVKGTEDIEIFYLKIIYPALKRIGDLWEENEISVAQEHMASSIITRVMSVVYSENVDSSTNKGKVIVASAPGELHEIGAWMLSDMLEINGWDICYVGSSTPEKDLIQQMKEFNPHILAISITMPFNLTRAANLIQAIRNLDKFKDLPIIVGGPQFNETENLYKSIGADGYAPTPREALTLIEKLYNE